jgi:hypothetical protein
VWAFVLLQVRLLLSFRAQIGDSFAGQMHNEVCDGDALLSSLFDANVTILFISIESLDLVWALASLYRSC